MSTSNQQHKSQTTPKTDLEDWTHDEFYAGMNQFRDLLKTTNVFPFAQPGSGRHLYWHVWITENVDKTKFRSIQAETESEGGAASCKQPGNMNVQISPKL